MSCGKHGTALQTGFVSRLRVCWKSRGLKVNLRRCLVYFWKRQLDVQESNASFSGPQCLKLFLWMPDHVWMGYLLLTYATGAVHRTASCVRRWTALTLAKIAPESHLTVSLCCLTCRLSRVFGPRLVHQQHRSAGELCSHPHA